MNPTAELLILPYDSASGRSLASRLISELESGQWRRFRAGVAFVRSSGNYTALVTALRKFAEGGNTVELTFGADTFGGRTKGSDFDAIGLLLDELEPLPTARISLYHEAHRTFHPKVYMFDDEEHARALLIIGSSNWSDGGLVDNVEANALLHLDLRDDAQLHAYEQVAGLFEKYWSEP